MVPLIIRFRFGVVGFIAVDQIRLSVELRLPRRRRPVLLHTVFFLALHDPDSIRDRLSASRPAVRGTKDLDDCLAASLIAFVSLSKRVLDLLGFRSGGFLTESLQQFCLLARQPDAALPSTISRSLAFQGIVFFDGIFGDAHCGHFGPTSSKLKSGRQCSAPTR